MIKPFYNSHKESILILLRLLVWYNVLLVVFYAYIGLVDPRGGLYIPFLDSFNLIKGMLHAIIYPVKWLLQLLGYDTRQTNDTIGIVNGPGVRIAFACLGIRILIAFTTLLLAFPGKNKLPFWILGICAIHLLNIGRIFSMVYFNDGQLKIILIAHTVFNYTSYVLIVLLFYLWYKKYGKKTDSIS